MQCIKIEQRQELLLPFAFASDHEDIEHTAQPVHGLQKIGSGGVAVGIQKGGDRPQLRFPGGTSAAIQPSDQLPICSVWHEVGLTIEILGSVAVTTEFFRC